METAAEWSRRFWYQAGVNDAKLAALLASLAAERPPPTLSKCPSVPAKANSFHSLFGGLGGSGKRAGGKPGINL
jgi:hypothetical protein